MTVARRGRKEEGLEGGWLHPRSLAVPERLARRLALMAISVGACVVCVRVGAAVVVV